jgi:hypothetical protein
VKLSTDCISNTKQQRSRRMAEQYSDISAACTVTVAAAAIKWKIAGSGELSTDCNNRTSSTMALMLTLGVAIASTAGHLDPLCNRCCLA